MTMVTGYSRFASAVLIPSRNAEDLYAGWWQLIAGLGAVPRVLVWDGEGAVGRWRGKRAELTGHCQAFRGVLGSKVHGGHARQRLEQRSLGMRGQGVCQLAFKTGDLGVEQADLGEGGANDRLEHLLRDRIRVGGRCPEPTDQLRGGLAASITVPAAELLHASLPKPCR